MWAQLALLLMPLSPDSLPRHHHLSLTCSMKRCTISDLLFFLDILEHNTRLARFINNFFTIYTNMSTVQFENKKIVRMINL